ncbi:ArsR/SmtB family transcription factor [Haloarcula nitratireducens]|uniref:Helix-turn-helix domain-containing protein n=1 Tax=Haloarcula nitratireducens TaxID=2487749 RepID=A0AAW4PBY1_9EURY|nr:helix-turn-helix domain-containing protein [Halomicroarcula nitratireducens]MBX0295328.1 helix-turn-helix domain-containing protein [Halomicroarcula nitratireducens]
MDLRTQDLIDAVSTEEAREILQLASREPMSVQNLQEEIDVSAATIYRHTDDLVEANYLKEETEITDNGDQYSTFRTKVNAVTFTVERDQFRVDVQVRDDIVDRFSRVWRSLGERR